MPRKPLTRVLLGTGALVGVLATAPAGAHAGCAFAPLLDRLARVDVVFTGEALPGPADPAGGLVSPARFRVLRWDRGGSASTVAVTTGLTQSTDASGQPVYQYSSEGFFATAGRIYRVFGVRGDDGVIATGGCGDSSAISGRPPEVTVKARGAPARRLPVTDFRGRRARGRLPRLAVERGGKIKLRFSQPVPEVAITRAGTTRAYGALRGGATPRVSATRRLTFPRRSRARRPLRIVVHTVRAFYAFTLEYRRR